MFIEIRVIQDCGQRMTEWGPIKLATGTQHYLKRSDVEDLIMSGKVQHVD